MTVDHFASIRSVEKRPRRPSPNWRKQRQGGKGHAPAQDELVAFVIARISETGAPPSVKDVQTHMGWKHLHSATDAVSRVAVRLPKGVALKMLADSGIRRRVW